MTKASTTNGTPMPTPIAIFLLVGCPLLEELGVGIEGAVLVVCIEVGTAVELGIVDADTDGPSCEASSTAPALVK